MHPLRKTALVLRIHLAARRLARRRSGVTASSRVSRSLRRLGEASQAHEHSVLWLVRRTREEGARSLGRAYQTRSGLRRRSHSRSLADRSRHAQILRRDCCTIKLATVFKNRSPALPAIRGSR